MNTIFTADHHLFHKNILRLQGRPFVSLEEMHESYIDGWNSAVRCEDTVYHLGDLSFASAERTQQVLKQINGRLKVVPGNHDGWLKQVGQLYTRSGPIQLLPPLVEIKLAGRYFTLCHYALRAWNRSHYGSWCLHGHSHGGLGFWPHSLDVGIDVYPSLLPLEEVLAHG